MYSRLLTPCVALAITALVPSVVLAGGDVGFEFDLHGYYIIDFVVFFGALIYFGRRPIAAMLDQRHKTVAAEIDAARAFRQEAQVQYNQSKVRLERLEEELEKVISDVRSGTEIECGRILADARQTADRIASDEKTRLQQEAKKIRDELGRFGAELALQLAETKVRDRLGKKTAQDRFMERAVSEIEQMQSEVRS